MSFRVGELTLTSRLIEGEFPNYRQLLPDQHESRLTVSRQQLLDAVSRVGLLARDTTPVRLEFNALGVKLSSSSSPDLGQAVETVEARYEGEDLTVAFNPQYLVDGLTRGERRERPARRSRRAEARCRAGRERRVHLPRDARAAACRGLLIARRIGSPPAMRLAWIELRRFRNHEHTRLDPMPDGLIVVVAPNGEGKTNLLEGMHFLYALGSPAGLGDARRSCRTAHDAAYARGRVRDAQRQGARRGRDPREGREPRPGEPVARPSETRPPHARSAR